MRTVTQLSLLTLALTATACAIQVTRVAILPCRPIGTIVPDAEPLVIQRGTALGLASGVQAVVIPRGPLCDPVGEARCRAVARDAGWDARWDERVGCVVVSTSRPELGGAQL